MTKALVTPYDVGDIVRLVRDQEQDGRSNTSGKNGRRYPRVAERGVIRRIIISDPNDGDATFPMFYVKFTAWGATALLHADDFALVAKNETRSAPAIAPEDAEWLRRQLATLGEGA
jgi:hypothetical protein